MTLYPLKTNRVQEVINALKTHLTLFPHFSVAKTDFGPEMSRQLTEFLAMLNILHHSSVANRSQSQGQPEITIKIIRSLMNRITEASNVNRNKWADMLPFIAQTINSTHLSSAKGHSRAQLLFSPYIQLSGLPSEDLFTIQETTFKRILSNRQKNLTDRQQAIIDSALAT